MCSSSDGVPLSTAVCSPLMVFLCQQLRDPPLMSLFSLSAAMCSSDGGVPLSTAVCSPLMVVFLCQQLCVPTELHAAGSVGHWLCDRRRSDTADHPSKQVPVSGPAGWTERGIVSDPL